MIPVFGMIVFIHVQCIKYIVHEIYSTLDTPPCVYTTLLLQAKEYKNHSSTTLDTVWTLSLIKFQKQFILVGNGLDFTMEMDTRMNTFRIVIPKKIHSWIIIPSSSVIRPSIRH